MNERINKKKVMYHFLNHVTEIVLILVVIALWIATDSFMKLNNWMNLLRSGAIKGLIALGVTMVLICGKIDLSTGSQVGLSGMFVAVFCKNMVAAGYNQTLACLIGILPETDAAEDTAADAEALQPKKIALTGCEGAEWIVVPAHAEADGSVVIALDRAAQQAIDGREVVFSIIEVTAANEAVPAA